MTRVSVNLRGEMLNIQDIQELLTADGSAESQTAERKLYTRQKKCVFIKRFLIISIWVAALHF